MILLLEVFPYVFTPPHPPGIAMIEFVVKLTFSVFLNMTLLVLFTVEPNHVQLLQFSPCLYDTCFFLEITMTSLFLLAHYSLSLILPDQPIKFLRIIFSFAIWLITYVINFVFLALSLLEFPCPLSSVHLVGFEARCHSGTSLSLFCYLIPPFLCLPLSWFMLLLWWSTFFSSFPWYMGGKLFEFLHDWQQLFSAWHLLVLHGILDWKQFSFILALLYIGGFP